MIDENKTILTEEELDQVVETLNNNEDPKADALEKAKETDEEEELEEGTLYVSSDLDGQTRILGTEPPETPIDASLSDIEDGEFLSGTHDESIKETFSTVYDISDEEAQQMLELIIKYKNGEKVSYYNLLPDTIKERVRNEMKQLGATPNPQNLAAFTKMLLDEFISEAKIDEAFADFQASLEKELDIPSMVDMYSSAYRDQMEIKLMDLANTLEESGDVEKAEQVREVSRAYTDAYKFTTVRQFLKTNRKARKRIKDTSKFNRFCDDFDFAAKKSKFRFKSMHLVYNALQIAFRLWDEDDAKKVVIMICSAYRLKSHENIVDTALMYYTVNNLCMLAHFGTTKTDFGQEIVDNVESLHDEILEAEREIAAETNPNRRN